MVRLVQRILNLCNKKLKRINATSEIDLFYWNNQIFLNFFMKGVPHQVILTKQSNYISQPQHPNQMLFTYAGVSL